MSRLTLIPSILLLAWLATLAAANAADPGITASKPSTNLADPEGLQAFLGAPLSLPLQQLWKGRGGTNIVTARDGTVIAFQSMVSNKIRRSPDGGRTWDADREIGPGATYGNALVDETSDDILYVNPAKQWLWRSREHGLTWARETITVRPDGFGLVPNTVSSMQPGITLEFGPHAGRLLMPARIQGPKYSNDVQWRPYHYNSAIYSDDGGASWQTSKPFPVLGTGEGALAEISDGRILYNSREHMSPGNRFLAWIFDETNNRTRLGNGIVRCNSLVRTAVDGRRGNG
jgi:sialidase-1